VRHKRRTYDPTLAPQSRPLDPCDGAVAPAATRSTRMRPAQAERKRKTKIEKKIEKKSSDTCYCIDARGERLGRNLKNYRTPDSHSASRRVHDVNAAAAFPSSRGRDRKRSSCDRGRDRGRDKRGRDLLRAR
jgi:hypothetical protein